MPKPNKFPTQIPGIKVTQWLEEWNEIHFDKKTYKKKPEPCFYIFSLSAPILQSLSGIYPRTTKGGQRRSQDLGIQRQHEKPRSEEINQFIHFGFPWSDLSERKRRSQEFSDLRKPGWLPTAIVVNILIPNDKRQGKNISKDDLITIQEKNSNVSLNLPKNFKLGSWKPKGLPPIEIIDGQHRLWAFEKTNLKGDFELPVVAFYGLDISWQAYLFWTINIKPKRINPSLAFDLYPLLRAEDWLDKFEGHSIYRETRAQELTEVLWSYPESPWYQRINMLGERGLKKPMVTQASWIRSLMATNVKSYKGSRVRVGGLFGAPTGKHETVIGWNRPQQAAFLILMGQILFETVTNCTENWAKALRKNAMKPLFGKEDPALHGPHTLINTDQGIRAILYIFNDLFYVRAKELKLESWSFGSIETDDTTIKEALSSLKNRKMIVNYFREIANCLKKFDWRTSAASGLTEDEQIRKSAFRGSGGYKVLRIQLLKPLSLDKKDVGKASKDVLAYLGSK